MNSRYDEDAGNESPSSWTREPGSRRRKLAGYLKAANELRQAYTQSYRQGWTSRDPTWDEGEEGGYPDAAVVRSGDEEMILFPSYARKHVKKKPSAEPGTIQEVGGAGRDSRDTTGEGDAEFWKQQWENYESDNAIVDVNVRGWVYSPHKGPMTRKHRLFIGLARQLVGIPAPTGRGPQGNTLGGSLGSRSPSPSRNPLEARSKRHEEEQISKEAESILRKGEAEAAAAGKGQYSEDPTASVSAYDLESRANSPRNDSRRGNHAHRLAHAISTDSLKEENDPPITALQKRASWNQPANMSPDELAVANRHLMARLRPFLANPLGNTPISVFFYNDEISRQRTVYTDNAGHFNLRAALDFVPTHVRILATDSLSATEEVIITEPKGVSLISDIDDTIKHSAISSGAREIFRNVFIRELNDLTIEGVKEWYSRMYELGVKFHYVSNSPWQIYPVLTKFFKMAGLPPGSFHLKQYSGMLQGIFEPVAERKKGTLDRIANDFPERKFILVGDSGEADLEVYTDFVLENPGRVLAVFIRDVTTTQSKGFFDSSMGPLTGIRSNGSSSGQNSAQLSKSLHHLNEEDDADLKAAIAASLRDMEKDKNKGLDQWAASTESDAPQKRPQLPPRRTSEPPAPQAQSMEAPVGNLIDFSDDDVEPGKEKQLPARSQSGQIYTPTQSPPANKATAKFTPPAPPPKPKALRGNSEEKSASAAAERKTPPPPPPRRGNLTPSNSQPNRSSPLSQEVSHSSRPEVPPKPPLAQSSYAASARQKLMSAYNNLPSASSYLYGTSPSARNPNSARGLSTSSPQNGVAPPAPPPRRAISSYPASAANAASSKVTSVLGYPSSPSQRYSTGTGHDDHPDAEGSARVKSPANSGLGPNGPPANQLVSKKEFLWQQRWARAERIMGEKGVLLRSWRVGFDVMDEAVRLVEKANEELGMSGKDMHEMERMGKQGQRKE